MGRIAFGPILVAMVFFAATANAWADPLSGWTGELSSAVVRPMPSQPEFDVLIYDDTKQNLDFRSRFLQALRRAGHRTSNNADLQFTFATSITWRASHLRELERRQLQRYPVDMEEASFPDEIREEIGSASASHLFGDRRRRPSRLPPTITNAEQDRLDISVELRSRKSGKIFWTADLALPLLAPNRARIVASITGPIIRAVGRDVRRERFEIR